jgi:hypothetical protein
MGQMDAGLFARRSGQQLIQETDFATPGIRSRPGQLHKKGDARSQKLKVLCISCNTHWMRELQDQTKQSCCRCS